MALTPMMRQYMEVKDRYTDCILFFRLGDFYEMFFDDAKTASRELELVLTGRDCGLEERAPMCGIPFHASSAYISRLVSKGYKVAICEQVEDPAAAKGIVRRDVVKVITPGTFIDGNGDNDYKNLYMMSIYEDNNVYGIAVSDISTGEFKTTYFTESIENLLGEIARFSPKEIIVDLNLCQKILDRINETSSALITKKNFENFNSTDEELKSQFVTLDLESLNYNSKVAVSVLLKYIYDTQKISLSNIDLLEEYNIIDFMSIDGNSRRNLELTENLREKSKKGSLLWVLDKTATSMGGRTLRSFIEQPLINKTQIEERNSAVEELYDNMFFNEEIREHLKEIYDIERITGKISNKNVNAKDLISLKYSLDKLPAVKNKLYECKSPLLLKWAQNLDVLDDIRELLNNSLLEEPSIGLKEGNIIKNGYSKDVDELRDIKSNGKQWIASLEQSEREHTGIRSLKVGYNKVFGYYIEISKANYSSIPEGRYIRKQTLANAERYITEELKIMEEKILGAEDKLIALEYELFVEIREKVEGEIQRLKDTAKIVGLLDVISTLALVAYENNYVKPKINENGIIDIKEGRHPVVEKVIGKGEFVSNNTYLNKKENMLLIITGPNMAGKSTYMRQVALITLMAQIGSFVPAVEANISICDKIFTRIGASDDLAGGKSTFMVEMWEVSNILNNATNNSLVLLDEVGRGTSTYDGLSIAWSVIEYIAKKSKLKCNTLFATHYHELTNLEGVIDGVKNYSVAVKEINDEVIFLRKIVEGGADQSYGIEVAKIAGLPSEVIERAKEILSGLESEEKFEIRKEALIEEEAAVDSEIIAEKNETLTIKKEQVKEPKIDNVQMDFTMIEKEALLKSIKELDVMVMTPLDAMNILFKLVQDAKKIL